MKIRRLLSLLLIALLVCALFPAPVAAAAYTEVDSAAELMQALAETPAQALSARREAQTPTRILVLEPALPDDCGAQRVLHYAAAGEFILEYPTRAAAEKAYVTLTGTCGLQNCWLDTPENGAHVLEGGASALDASTWGAGYMHLTAYRDDPHTLAHFNAAAPIVAIIDSGVDPNNAALMARSYMSYDFVNNTAAMSEVSGENNARGHGTRVASILNSVLPQNVKFMYLRVFDDAGSGGMIAIRTAIQYAAEQGAAVANLSLGWEDDYNQTKNYLDNAMQSANTAGMTMVCAAGNKHQDVENCYPANSSYTIAVSAVNQNQRYEVYSNYGALVDFCAPGSGIQATTVGGSVVSCTGTSFAAPHITAVVALLKILEPAATPARVYALLRTYAYDLGVAGKDNIYGWGIPILPATYEGRFRHTWDEGRVTKAATASAEGECVYTCTVCGLTHTEVIPAKGSGFVDVQSGTYYYLPVVWAAEQGITTGTDDTHFTPDGICTRAQVVTFLWRAAGSPAPTTSANPFTDVPADAYYRDAVLWAVEKNVTKGTSETTFSPEDTCTRAHVATFLWRAAGSVPPKTARNPFLDVPDDAYYHDAVLWAVERNVTKGTSETTFSPGASCTRAHVVTFLYRYLVSADV